jgi:HEAT repeat protein
LKRIAAGGREPKDPIAGSLLRTVRSKLSIEQTGGAVRRHRWRYAIALALGSLGLAVIAYGPRPAPLILDPTMAHDPPMIAIKELVSSGNLAAAISRLAAAYRFNQRHGLAALQQFSMIVLERGLNESDPFERYFAASALAKGGSRRGVHLLMHAFQGNPDLSLKMAAADGLGDIGDAYAVGLLQKLYYASGDFDRRIVVNAMAEASDPGAIEVLSDAAGGSDQELRLAGLQGLGKLGARGAVPLLRQVMLGNRPSIERAMAAASLLRLGEPPDLKAIQPVLADRRDGNARAVAFMALGYANDARVVPMLRQAIADDNLDVRIGAAVALTHYRDQIGVNYLKAAMVDAQDAVTRQHVGQALDQVAFDGGYDVLIAAVGSVDSNLQMSGLRAIGLGGGAKEIPLLNSMLPHLTDPLMRAQIAWSLGRFGRPGCIETLITMVQENDPAVRYTAADALDRTAQHLWTETRG